VIGIDTSFFVGLAIREHPSHRSCARLFRENIVGRSGSMMVAPQVLAEFCHVVTDPRRFERPLEVSDATGLCEQWWGAEECSHALVDAEVGTLFLAWMREYRLGRKRLLDTLLAATYHRAGAKRIASTDWRDFALFGVFELYRL
jgi:predicted nucleic acid-binding protein